MILECVECGQRLEADIGPLPDEVEWQGITHSIDDHTAPFEEVEEA